jgi:hypothetical protein
VSAVGFGQQRSSMAAQGRRRSSEGSSSEMARRALCFGVGVGAEPFRYAEGDSGAGGA